MPQLSPAARKWLQGFTEIERLQQEIFTALGHMTNKADEDETTLTNLVKQQDLAIRQLPFAQLNAEDVAQLNDKIALLQQNHQSLINAISHQRQALLDQSSQHKKAGRSIKAYQRAQDL
ncbi:hypothetical protein SAMN03080615_03851 [Amphritea atlantica]|uniref:Flagellar protein FliT n=1 Tax=Amphritea atlantica TaxID=355243 RepID=A0A1H9L9C6_9GAMM|nr:hypothetical protein [Amphritea atlantica]SER08004.1 hypothetical protein SAMN03080615_03851 [Amphritea atlantica]